ncbi:unnamed protein product [Clonostachys rosea f. rosea IK726]|nr:unnamed protein product [Clonostachys rosea f. rosea IK726]
MSGRITSAGRITRGSDAGGRLAWCSSVLLGRFYLFRRSWLHRGVESIRTVTPHAPPSGRDIRNAGLPAGVLNVIQTRREDAAAVTEAFIAHREIRKIEFIGSARVGRHIGSLAGEHLKPVQMELGGKAAALVLDDADLTLAATGCVHGSYMHNGQTCFSTERVIVNAAVVDKFFPILKKTAADFPVLGAVSNTGPENTLRLVQDALKKGAKLIYGEARLIKPGQLHPLILSEVTLKYPSLSCGACLEVPRYFSLT